MACKEHAVMIQKVDRNVTYTKLGVAVIMVSIGVVGAIISILNADIKINTTKITTNTVAISKQEGKFEIIIRQLDRIEGKLSGK